MFDFVYNAAEKVKLWVSRHYTKLSGICLSFFVAVFSFLPAYAVDGTTVFLAPTSQTSIYFDSSISDSSILLTCKSTVASTTPWEIVVSPPLAYADSDGDYYITFVNYRSYNPNVVFYNSNGSVINALSIKKITIDSVSYDTNAFVYQLPKTLAYIKVGGGGSGTLAVNQTVFLSAYFSPYSSGESNSDIVSAIESQTNQLISKFDETNDIIINGGSGTSSVISGLTENLTEFNTTVDNITEFEADILSDFSAGMDSISFNVDIIGSFSDAFSWLSDNFGFISSTDDIYFYFIFMPCIIGVAMFFVGRGGYIIGGLYRKPFDSSTTTVSTGYTVFDDNGFRRSETSTHTRGGGGIFRR